MNRPIFAAVIFIIVLASLPSSAQQNPSGSSSANAAVSASAAPELLVVGKQGWVTFTVDTKLGSTLLKPGNYYLQHEARGDSHVMTFQRLGDPDIALQNSDLALDGPPVTAYCKVENLNARAKHTTILTAPAGAQRRITRIEVKGENVAHVF